SRSPPRSSSSLTAVVHQADCSRVPNKWGSAAYNGERGSRAIGGDVASTQGRPPARWSRWRTASWAALGAAAAVAGRSSPGADPPKPDGRDP
ncbi:hypothetical protein Dimus_007581, partial [Dionaea muscipula]